MWGNSRRNFFVDTWGRSAHEVFILNRTEGRITAISNNVCRHFRRRQFCRQKFFFVDILKIVKACRTIFLARRLRNKEVEHFFRLESVHFFECRQNVSSTCRQVILVPHLRLLKITKNLKHRFFLSHFSTIFMISYFEFQHTYFAKDVHGLTVLLLSCLGKDFFAATVTNLFGQPWDIAQVQENRERERERPGVCLCVWKKERERDIERGRWVRKRRKGERVFWSVCQLECVACVCRRNSKIERGWERERERPIADKINIRQSNHLKKSKQKFPFSLYWLLKVDLSWSNGHALTLKL